MTGNMIAVGRCATVRRVVDRSERMKTRVGPCVSGAAVGLSRSSTWSSSRVGGSPRGVVHGRVVLHVE